MGLQLNTEVSISDIISLLSLFAIVVGGVFALVKWNSNVKVRRAEYIDKLYTKRSDERTRNVLYTFDQTENWYSLYREDKKFEIEVDDALAFFSYICYLKNEGLLKKKEFTFFEYDIKRILNNKQVQYYFKELNCMAAGGEIPSCYKDLIEYGKKMGLKEYVF